MTIKKLSNKKTKTQKSNPELHEEIAGTFISSGGQTIQESQQKSKKENFGLFEELSRFTLRLPKNMMKRIDSHRKTQIGSISRNTWILQVIANKLKSK